MEVVKDDDEEEKEAKIKHEKKGLSKAMKRKTNYTLVKHFSFYVFFSFSSQDKMK